MCFSPQRRAIFRHQNCRQCSEDYSFSTFSLPNCAFRHSSVHFFDGWRAKSVSELTCFVHFHFKMCFSPQRRAFFWHLDLQKCSEHVMFCTFWLPNVLFATAACIFSTSELTKSAPNTSCFVHFDFRMCFSPQRRAIFDFSSELRPPHPPL